MTFIGLDLDHLDPADRRVISRFYVEHTALRFQVAAIRYGLALQRASYNPDQPRVPAGNPDGGRWSSADEGGSDAVGTPNPVRLAEGGPVESDEPPLPGEREPNRSPAPIFRVVPNPLSGVQIDTNDPEWAYTSKDAEDAVARARKLEPDWEPTLGFYNDTQGAIANNREVQAEAEARLNFQQAFRFGHNGPPDDPNDPATQYYDNLRPDRPFDTYRAITGLPELGGAPAESKDDGTVAVADVNGRAVIGVNSTSSGYTDQDWAAAQAMRDQLIRKYPNPDGPMKVDNTGQRPNNAIFHAEGTALMRAARAKGGSLKGLTIDMEVDRDFCRDCELVLPYIGLELGDPVVNIRDPTGQLRTMHGGKWQKR